MLILHFSFVRQLTIIHYYCYAEGNHHEMNHLMLHMFTRKAASVLVDLHVEDLMASKATILAHQGILPHSYRMHGTPHYLSEPVRQMSFDIL